MDLQVVAARGSEVIDARGRRYIDFFMGSCCGNLGWGHREIRARLRRFRGPDYVAPDYLYEPWVELAGLLAEITPGRLRRSFRAVGGTEAVEIALQAAMVCTGRHRFVSIERGYHGNSIAAVSVGASEDGEGMQLLPGCRKIEPPLDERALGKAETLLKRRDVAAVIMEPVSMNIGVLIPDPVFMSGIAELCQRFGTLLIMDEVACGFGRTGALFATEHYDIEPDILCLAKAITGGHAPLGATIMTDEVADEVAEELDFYSTYGWHPLAVEAALANVRYIMKHRDALMHNVEQRSRQFADRVGTMDFAGPATLHIKGLAVGVELHDGDYANQVVDRCRHRGLLLSNSDEILKMFPALNIDRATAERGLDILESCL